MSKPSGVAAVAMAPKSYPEQAVLGLELDGIGLVVVDEGKARCCVGLLQGDCGQEGECCYRDAGVEGPWVHPVVGGMVLVIPATSHLEHDHRAGHGDKAKQSKAGVRWVLRGGGALWLIVPYPMMGSALDLRPLTVLSHTIRGGTCLGKGNCLRALV